MCRLLWSDLVWAFLKAGGQGGTELENNSPRTPSVLCFCAKKDSVWVLPLERDSV